VLQNLPDSVLSVIAMMYRLCLNNAYTPFRWRQMKVIFIPKPNKDNYNTTSMFRPISLSSFFFKGLEKVIKWSWKDSSMSEPLPYQLGFTENTSCDTALDTLVNFVEKGINKKGGICVAVFLESQGAFDNIQFSSIKRELINKGTSKESVDWYCQMLENRVVKAEIKDRSCIAQLTQGLAQGGGLSDIIWNVTYQPVISEILQTNCNPNALADDNVLLSMGNDLEAILKDVQKSIEKVLQWGNKEKLTFNAAKTAVLVFSRKPGFHAEKLPNATKLKMGDTELPFTDEMVYLGVN